MTQEGHARPEAQRDRQNVMALRILQMSGAGFFVAGVLLALAAVTVGVGFVELPIPAPWLSAGLVVLGAMDFAAAKVLIKQQPG